MSGEAWRVSLHGGHSGAYCDHARGTLEEVVEAAIARGIRVYGLSEHAPRFEARHLYDEERRRGWTVETLASQFDAFVVEARRLQAAHADRIELLVGMETEVVPVADWLSRMVALRARHGLDFVVGSVHHVGDTIIDATPELFEEAMAASGGFEALVLAYHRAQREMVEALRPEVVGHVDLVRKLGWRYGDVDAPAARVACEAVLDAVATVGAILDLNTAGLRKGLPHPYPAPWIVAAARDRGIDFCFGDDSHGPDDVGSGLDAGRAYLLEQGVREVVVLRRGATGVTRERVAL